MNRVVSTRVDNNTYDLLLAQGKSVATTLQGIIQDWASTQDITTNPVCTCCQRVLYQNQYVIARNLATPELYCSIGCYQKNLSAVVLQLARQADPSQADIITPPVWKWENYFGPNFSDTAEQEGLCLVDSEGQLCPVKVYQASKQGRRPTKCKLCKQPIYAITSPYELVYAKQRGQAVHLHCLLPHQVESLVAQTQLAMMQFNRQCRYINWKVNLDLSVLKVKDVK